MSEAANLANCLREKEVAFTGRLASLTRKEAGELIRSHDGLPVPRVSRNTAYLIVGQQNWPLRRDGQLTTNLRKARQLQEDGHSIIVLSEEAFLNGLGLDGCSDTIRR